MKCPQCGNDYPFDFIEFCSIECEIEHYHCEAEESYKNFLERERREAGGEE